MLSEFYCDSALDIALKVQNIRNKETEYLRCVPPSISRSRSVRRSKLLSKGSSWSSSSSSRSLRSSPAGGQFPSDLRKNSDALIWQLRLWPAGQVAELNLLLLVDRSDLLQQRTTEEELPRSFPRQRWRCPPEIISWIIDNILNKGSVQIIKMEI